MTSPRETGDYLRLKLHGRVAEVFCVLWLDNRHRVLAFEELFQGTVDGASVYAREVVRAAIKWNAAACVFSHNHPSGMAEPSAADRAITITLRDALALIGTRVLDHVVIGEGEPVSMAARGLMWGSSTKTAMQCATAPIWAKIAHCSQSRMLKIQETSDE